MVTPTIETSIWLALRTRVEALDLTPALAVAWPNESFTKPAPSVSYIEVTHIPNRTGRVFIGSDEPHRYQGILQVSLMATLNQNAAVAIEIAGDIANHFAADTNMASGSVAVRVTRHPSVGPVRPDATHVHVPISIEYECWA